MADSNELVKQPQTNEAALIAGKRGIVLHNIDEVWRFAVIVHKANMAPKSFKSVEQIALGIQTGMELGLSPMASLRGIMVINNLPSVWGDALRALVERSPECEYIKETIEGEGATLTATCVAKRVGRPEPTVQTFSHQDAKTAGLLGKDIWQKYERRMLQMRARSYALRDQFPDLIWGLTTVEEARDIEPDEPVVPDIEAGDLAPEDEIEAVLTAMAKDDSESVEAKTESDYGETPAPPPEAFRETTITDADKKAALAQQQLEMEA